MKLKSLLAIAALALGFAVPSANAQSVRESQDSRVPSLDNVSLGTPVTITP